MEKLAQLLDKLLETLQALNGVLEEEHDLLCSGQLPGVALQRVTDAKSQLLATVAYLEQQRLGQEKTCGQRAPYASHAPWPTVGSAFNCSAKRCAKRTSTTACCSISRSTITLRRWPSSAKTTNRCMARTASRTPAACSAEKSASDLTHFAR